MRISSHPPQRARKRHWTKEEDAELVKGFQRYGFNWNSIVKDPYLRFDNRSAGQVRDRFRLKHKDIYALPAEARGPPRQPDTGARVLRPRNTNHRSKQHGSTAHTSEPIEEVAGGNGAQSSTVYKSIGSIGLNSNITGKSHGGNNDCLDKDLHNDTVSDGSLTQATSLCLSWEDMAIRPVFPLD